MGGCSENDGWVGVVRMMMVGCSENNDGWVGGVRRV